MAKSFGEVAGAAKKGKQYKWVDGEQTIRLVGNILPRYVYWKSTGEFNIPVECLGFDRDLEKFTNIEKDWFQDMFPEQKCAWSYMATAIDPEDKSKTILVPLKKKMYQQIQDVAAELGDPTNVDSGWDIIVNRVKTGPANYNVEYTVKQLKCKNRALSAEEKAAVEAMPSIDTLVPRQTADEQKAFILATFFNRDDTETDEEAAKEFDDIPQ